MKPDGVHKTLFFDFERTPNLPKPDDVHTRKKFPKPDGVNTTLRFEVKRTLKLPKLDGVKTSLGRNVHMTLRINVEKTLNFVKPGVVRTKRSYQNQLASIRRYC